MFSKTIRHLVACGLTALAVLFTTAAQAESPAIDQEADKVLKRMSNYLGDIKQFSVDMDNTIEVLLDSGQKIMLAHSGSVSLKRPDKFKISRKGDVVDQDFFYDGKMFVLHGKNVGFYASIDAPDTIDSALDYAIEALDLVAPGADLLHQNSYGILTEDVISGIYVGKGFINGVESHHLAFRNSEVDWQLWVQTGDKPLPVKFVITSKWTAGSPQFELNLKNWNTKPKLADEMFTFAPPKGVERIDFVTSSVATSAKN